MFYEFDQNNSGGSFMVDDKVCHRLFIEADTEHEALIKAEELGCYWDGVALGMDCSCCGDRWSEYTNEVNLDEYQTEGYPASVYSHYQNPEQRWQEKYGHYDIIENPQWKKEYSIAKYDGKISFKNIEEYAQFLADEYGWTTPDVRIFYKDGNVTEIFSKKVKN